MENGRVGNSLFRSCRSLTKERLEQRMGIVSFWRENWKIDLKIYITHFGFAFIKRTKESESLFYSKRQQERSPLFCIKKKQAICTKNQRASSQPWKMDTNRIASEKWQWLISWHWLFIKYFLSFFSFCLTKRVYLLSTLR